MVHDETEHVLKLAQNVEFQTGDKGVLFRSKGVPQGCMLCVNEFADSEIVLVRVTDKQQQ